MRALARLSTAAHMARLLPSFLAFGVLRHTVSLRTLVRFAWTPARASRDRRREQQLIAHAVKLGHLFPMFDRNCLQRSLLLYRELARAGANPELVIGMSTGNDGIRGHAWIVLDDEPLIDTRSTVDAFVPVCVFASRGELRAEAESRERGEAIL
jgi:hypothetical protein